MPDRADSDVIAKLPVQPGDYPAEWHLPDRELPGEVELRVSAAPRLQVIGELIDREPSGMRGSPRSTNLIG